MKIQACTKQELEDCASLLAEVYNTTPYHETWNVASARSYLARFHGIEPEGCYVAKNNQLIVGAVFSYSYPWHDSEMIYIQELFVSSAFRRQGVAKSLINAVSNRKNEPIWLVANQQTKANDFYHSLGFSKNSRYKIYSGNRDTKLQS